MSDTDIYKQREAMPMGKKPSKKKRRRRSASHKAFDDTSRKRRSKNSGMRRLLHLSRKSENEKIIWGVTGAVFVVVLLLIGLWQFVIQEHLIREQEKSDDYSQVAPGIPKSSDEPLISNLTPAEQQREDSASE